MEENNNSVPDEVKAKIVQLCREYVLGWSDVKLVELTVENIGFVNTAPLLIKLITLRSF